MNITKVSIIGSVCWGGGLGLHAEYHLLVIPEDTTAQWTVYRRFSAFTKLHKRIVTKVGGDELAKQKGLVLPVNYFGSRLNATSDSINQRKAELQKYLDTVLTLEDISEEDELLKFLDVSGRGISGIVLDAGVENVLRESFVQVKLLKSIPFGLWSWSFVALLRDGSLCVLQSKYDNRNTALAVWKINGSDIRIVPKARNSTITISSINHDNKIILKLQTPEDSSFWMRALSEFSSASSYDSIMQQSREKAEEAKNSKRYSKPIQQSPVASNNAPVDPEHVHFGRTGATTDELSEMYGI